MELLTLRLTKLMASVDPGHHDTFSAKLVQPTLALEAPDALRLAMQGLAHYSTLRTVERAGVPCRQMIRYDPNHGLRLREEIDAGHWHLRADYVEHRG